ncbi:MAG TPA: undecaprenyl-diphosphate phosphatase [Candidatus Paceibacterota bacterium]|nr:undecaprenyl-diphosphate phosphatase [Candidatus Paceibacterota bacterium]
MLTHLVAVVLGVIEGIAEFLPISSTGHLIIAERLLRLTSTDFLTSFDITIQLGAILAVVMLFGKRLLTSWELLKRIVVAFIPTAVIGLVLYKIIKQLLGSPTVVLWMLGIGGVILIVFERWYDEPADAHENLETMPYRTAALLGVAQSVAVIPGVSRSAATIVGGLSLGLSRRAIVEFSFLLAIPTMAAASALDLYKSAGSFSGDQWGALSIGFVVSWLVALVAIRWLLQYIRSHDFTLFGMYRVIAALVFAVLLH